MAEKPLPLVNVESRPFWEGCKQHKLMLQRCNDGPKPTYFYYARSFAPGTLSTNIEWVEASGEGVIHSYTIARRGAGPAFAPDAPYVIAIIELAEGPRMLSNIRTANVESVKIGQKVKVFFEDINEEITLPKFEVVR